MSIYCTFIKIIDMKVLLKSALFLSLLISFSISSCGDADGVDDFKGIEIATTRSNGESEGIGLACNFGKIIKEHLNEIDLDEIKEEVGEEGGEDFDQDKFDELLDEIFGSISDKVMYVIVAGEDLDFEAKEGVGVAGETFSLTWFSNSEEPTTGTYQAVAAKINIEDPDDLENGAEVSHGEIEVILTEINDESMIGTFSGTVMDKDGVSENIEGAFNVDRTSCEK